MKKIFNYLAVAIVLLSACGEAPVDTQKNKEDQLKHISESLTIDASPAKVWQIITAPQYAKILGAEFDKNAYQESDWQLHSKVYFKYDPEGKIVATGTISKLEKEALIRVDYDFDGYLYNEQYILSENTDGTTLRIEAGPYTADYEAQKVVWKNWMQKVKTLSETS